MGTLLAFTAVAVSVLILRYIPPDKVPLPSSVQESIDSLSLQLNDNNQEVAGQNIKDPVNSCDHDQYLLDNEGASDAYPLLQIPMTQGAWTWLNFFSPNLSFPLYFCHYVWA